MASPAPLRLLAQDPDDLAVISAAMQDALTKVGDIAFDRRARVLTLGFNRFRWEAGGGERIRCGLQLGGVLKVQTRKIQRSVAGAVLEILALSFEAGEAPGGTLTIRCAGGGDIRATVECVDVVLADISQPWPTRRRPTHEA